MFIRLGYEGGKTRRGKDLPQIFLPQRSTEEAERENKEQRGKGTEAQSERSSTAETGENAARPSAATKS